MQLRIDRHILIIVPETDQDIAFLEDTMYLREDGDVIKFERVDNETNGSWIKFRVESYAPYIDESTTTPYRVPKKRVDTSRYKDFDDPDDTPTGDHVTLVDVDCSD